MRIGRDAGSGRFVILTDAPRPKRRVGPNRSRSGSASLHDVRTGRTYVLKGYGDLRAETKVKPGLDPDKPVAEQVKP